MSPRGGQIRTISSIKGAELVFPGHTSNMVAGIMKNDLDHAADAPALPAAKMETILVVDDSEIDRQILCTALEDAGYSTITAENGRKAIETLRKKTADLVFLDLMMPEMDGFETLKQFGRDDRLKGMPVIILSSLDDMGSVMRCLDMGATDYVSKPFEPALVRARINAALATRRMLAQQEILVRLMSREAAEKPPEPVAASVRPLPVVAEEENTGGGGVFAFVRFLLHWARPYRWQLAMLLVPMGLIMLYEAAVPASIKFITDDALMQKNFPLLVMLIAGLVSGAVITALLQVFWDYTFARVGTKLLNDLRMNIFRHLQRLSLGFYSRTQVGDITARFSTDMASIENTLMLAMPVTICQIIYLFLSIMILFYLEWKLAVFSLVGLCLTYWIEKRMEASATRESYRMKEAQAGVAAEVQENACAQPLIKAFGLQAHFTERFRRRMVDLFRVGSRAAFLNYLVEKVPDRSMRIFCVSTIGVGAIMTYHGYLTIGELVSFQALLSGLVASVGDLTWSLPHLINAGAGMRRIDELLTLAPEVADAVGARPMPRPSRDIVLEDVDFGYSPEKLNLKGVNIRITAGSRVALVGPSGAGKSTVLGLIARFYDPAKGRVLVDGQDAREFTQDSLRRHMSFVLQDTFLFNISARENIRMGRLDATDAEVEAAARVAGLHDAIMALPGRYDTLVGERGSRLSGAQRQRLAIARAMLCDPAVLVLDEACSAMDSDSAAAVSRTICDLSRGRTVISVTHRLDSAESSDRIFMFFDGVLVEQGGHRELLGNNGPYAAMWRKQTGFVINRETNQAEVEASRLRQIPLLQKLDERLLLDVAERFVTERFQAGRLVIQQGDPGDRFYIIVRGKASVSQVSPEGGTVRLAVLEDGDYFGEIALLKDMPRTASVHAVTDCIFLTLSMQQFAHFLDRNPRVREEMEKTISARVARRN